MPNEQLSPSQLSSLQRELLHRTVRRWSKLTIARARSALNRLDPDDLIVAQLAESEALTLLRAEGRSYLVETTGELYLSPRARLDKSSLDPSRRHTNLFATRTSRVTRYLLLHPRDEFTVTNLTRATALDKSVVSRVVAELEQDAFVRVETNEVDARKRSVRLADPRRVLDEWRVVWRRRRMAPKRFDIGTRSVGHTLRAIADAAGDSSPQWAISGVAGSSFVRRAVEPADVLLLTTKDGVAAWQTKLFAEPSNRGLLQIAEIPDPWVLTLAWPERQLRIADHVQLWLDTSVSGERAGAAADAIAKEAGW